MNRSTMGRLVKLEARAPRETGTGRVHLVAGEGGMTADERQAVMIAAGEGSPDDFWILLVPGEFAA